MRVFTGNGGRGEVSLRMELERYEINRHLDQPLYFFISDGPKGSIIKIVAFKRIKKGLYNLEFGDWDLSRKIIDDLVESNNNDRDKVLATVAATVVDFLHTYPENIVMAEGSTPARTRLYQMKIAQYLKEIDTVFEIEGLHRGKWERFVTGKNYTRFRLKLKF